MLRKERRTPGAATRGLPRKNPMTSRRGPARAHRSSTKSCAGLAMRRWIGRSPRYGGRGSQPGSRSVFRCSPKASCRRIFRQRPGGSSWLASVIPLDFSWSSFRASSSDTSWQMQGRERSARHLESLHEMSIGGGKIDLLQGKQPAESALSRRWRSRHENGYHKAAGGCSGREFGCAAG
jgi:hypothetical protein